jgi:hypothetical protein
MATEFGQSVEFFLTSGSWSDIKAYPLYDFDLPDHAWVTGDKANSDYDFQDALIETDIRMRPMRKKNSRRPVFLWIYHLQSHTV